MLSITTLTGGRFDLYPNETIEVNMGGISLLNLADRTVSYTNSFKLPRTANNEQLFEFASQPTRNNRPTIEVIITKGLFQKSATLKVKEFDGDYKCEVVYDSDNMLQQFSEININSLSGYNKYLGIYSIVDIPSGLDPIYETLCNIRHDGLPFFPVVYGREFGTTAKIGNAALSFLSILDLVESLTGVTFSGKFIMGGDLAKLIVFNKYIYSYVTASIGNRSVYSTGFGSDIDADVLQFSGVLKTILQLLLFDIKIDGKIITATSITEKINGAGINLETLSASKSFSSGYGLNNDVNYKLSKLITAGSYSDRFNGEGVGTKNILTLNSYIPPYYDTATIEGWDVRENDGKKETIIFSLGNTEYTTNIKFYTGISDGTLTNDLLIDRFSPLSLSPFYSSILNPIFANPVILSADGYIDPLTADTIMNDRVINSVKLGGRYWVDEMKYNLTTGKSVLKLIKL